MILEITNESQEFINIGTLIQSNECANEKLNSDKVIANYHYNKYINIYDLRVKLSQIDIEIGGTRNLDITKGEQELIIIGIRIQIDECLKGEQRYDTNLRKHYIGKKKKLHLLWEKVERLS